MKILIINGPNINMLGIREPKIYGNQRYSDLLAMLSEHSEKNGYETVFFQSNHEGAIVDRIQEAYYEKVEGIVINPAAYTHTSVAILDALKATSIPTVEVHISAVNERESYRQISYVREYALKTITGKGFAGYTEAVEYLIDHIENSKK